MNSSLVSLAAHLNRLWRYQELVWVWTQRELRVRYKQTWLGVGWAISQPLALLVIFTLIFTRVIPVSTGELPYPLVAYTGLIVWSFFSEALTQSAQSLSNNLHLIGKVNFPREIFPLALTIAAMFDFMITAVLLVGMMFLYRVPVTPYLLFVPLLVILQFAFTLALCLCLAPLNVMFRDVRFLLPLVLQIWFYASPIIYPVERVPQALQAFYLLNPIAVLVDSYRDVILRGEPPGLAALAWLAVCTVMLLAVAYPFFKHVEPDLMDYA